MGPVIECIDEGHWAMKVDDKAQRLICHQCRTSWPCGEIVEARVLQRGYAERAKMREQHATHKAMEVSRVR